MAFLNFKCFHHPLYCLLIIAAASFFSFGYDEVSNQTAFTPKCVERSLVAKGSLIVGKFNEKKVTYVDVFEITERLAVWGENVTFNQALGNTSGLTLKCYARYNAIPNETVHDYHADIRKSPLVILSPKLGRWYFIIHPVYQSYGDKGVQENDTQVCYSLDWEMFVCAQGTTGPNCAWKRHVLQAVAEATPMGPLIYLPKYAHKSLLSGTNFSVEPLLSRTNQSDELGHSWTYFLVYTSEGSSGKNVHIQLNSDVENFYELFIRFGGLPALEIWDYYCSNQTLGSSSSTNHSMFKLYDDDGKKINIYIFHAREGLWGIGLRSPPFSTSTPLPQTTMSITVEECVNQCSNRGTCQSYKDASGSTSYRCSCVRNHGGFDCSIDVVSQEVWRLHAISLILSNAAALLPAFWAIWQKACAESIVLMASGVFSAIYHACDVGWWCALPFSVLQFMDFWLSFMAVVSVFVYLVILSEAAKRTVHTIVAITTALIAASNPTRAINIVLVVAATFLALLVGCLQEYYHTKHMSFSRHQNMKEWGVNLTKRLYEYYHLSYFLVGFVVLSMAAITWIFQTNGTYWFWHSIWHMTVYISAFLFLCSKATIKRKDNGESEGNGYGNHHAMYKYELAPLNSSR